MSAKRQTTKSLEEAKIVAMERNTNEQFQQKIPTLVLLNLGCFCRIAVSVEWGGGAAACNLSTSVLISFCFRVPEKISPGLKPAARLERAEYFTPLPVVYSIAVKSVYLHTK